jgi:hypothetical protein
MSDVYRAQPSSNLRTFTDLRIVLNNYFARPQAAYYACQTARLHPTPADFRTGNEWPFVYGPIAKVFRNRCVYTPYVSQAQMDQELNTHPEVTRVIIWDLESNGRDWWLQSLAPPPSANHWVLHSQQEIPSYWYWTWEIRWGTLRRREFWKK